MLFSKIKNSKGYVAIESIIVMSGLIFFLLLFVSFLCYTLPKIMLEKEVQTLAQIAKIQGGLTDKVSQPVNSDIELFKANLDKMGFDISQVVIQAKTIPSGFNAIGVTPINSKTGTNYVKRDSKELIEIIIKVPADKSLFDSPLKFFGIKNTLSGVYTFREVVGSERW